MRDAHFLELRCDALSISLYNRTMQWASILCCSGLSYKLQNILKATDVFKQKLSTNIECT